jgi:hypothetical protein
MNSIAPLTDDEIVLLTNLLMPRMVELRKKDPYGDFLEARLMLKLTQMRQELLGQPIPNFEQQPTQIASHPDLLKHPELLK